MKLIEKNKKAYFDYFVEDTVEAGIVLTGCEIKSVRAGQVSLSDCFCHIDKGEAYLKNCYIAPYKHGSIHNADPKQNRKLLLSKKEISRLIGKVKEKGFSLIPLQLYFKGQWVKVLLGLCKGKKLHDKRQVTKEKELMRQAGRDISNMQKG
ncbi:MAG: SsrA-binding protein SmpB [Firmicutes bacterium]|nr:SsrA-binding protein SmpB [Bacillota bacterium]